MKRFLLTITVLASVGLAATAQPAKRRVTTSTAAANQRSAGAQSGKDRASLQLPTAASMPDDVVWKRDIYRQLDLMNDKNAPMYYPVEPQGRQVNLFTYLFRLILTGRVTAYTYKLDGNESFEPKDKLEVKDMLERYSIFYEEGEGGKLNVADSDVPSAEATRYYIKESVYLDQRTGTFSTRVTALCPILMRGDDEFGEGTGGGTPYPLFWVKYEDIAPYLARLPMMGSNLNNVSNMTADDFFTMNRYEGKIYKTNNLQGKVLANYCETDSAMALEQKKIEKQLTDFEEGVWGHRDEAQDSTADSTVVVARKTKASRRASSSEKAQSSSRRRNGGDSSAKSSSAPTVSARRQRR